jgi:hypothetical protein
MTLIARINEGPRMTRIALISRIAGRGHRLPRVRSAALRAVWMERDRETQARDYLRAVFVFPGLAPSTTPANGRRRPDADRHHPRQIRVHQRDPRHLRLVRDPRRSA